MADWLMGILGNLAASVIGTVIGLAWHHRRIRLMIGHAHERFDELVDLLDGPRHHHPIHRVQFENQDQPPA